MIGYKLAVVSLSRGTGDTHSPLALGRIDAAAAASVVVGGGGGGRGSVGDIERVIVVVVIVVVIVEQICGIIPRRT